MAEASLEKIANVAVDAALDFEYKGQTIREWAQDIAETDHFGKWIPVSERLPDQGQEVICQCRANIIRVLKLDACGDWCQDTNHCYMSGFVIAWMPLPEPYKQQESENET